MATQYAKDRSAFGRKLADFPLMGAKLAGIAARIYAVESSVYRIAGLLEGSLAAAEDATSPDAVRSALEEYAVECSVAKVLASEELGYVVDEVVQIHGGYGYIEEYPAAGFYRDARIHRIWEGTSEINRLLIPGTLLKRAMTGRLDLLGPAQRSSDLLMGGELPSFEGAFATDDAAVFATRTVTLLLAGAAVQRYATALEDEQELLAGLADLAIDLFAMESVVERARQAAAVDAPFASVHADLARLNVVDRLGERRAPRQGARRGGGQRGRGAHAGRRHSSPPPRGSGGCHRHWPADRGGGGGARRVSGLASEDTMTASPSTMQPASAERPWLAHYEAGVPADVDVPQLTVDGLVRRAAEQHPGRTALVFFGATTTYRQLDAAVDRFAHVLRGMGIQPGDRVSLHLPTSPAFVIAFMGALRTGAVVVPMSPLYVERELGVLFAQTRPSVAVVLDALVPRVRHLSGDAGVPDRMIVTGIQDSLPIPLRWLYPIKARRDGTWHPLPHTPETPNLFRLLRGAPSAPFGSAAAPEDLAVLQPTGGTTGTPKAAMLTHRNLVANAEQVAVWFPGAEEFPVVLAPLPFFHIYGLTVDLNYAMLAAGTLILLPRFDPHQVFAAIVRHRPSLFPGAPIMYQTLANHPDAGKYDLRSIRACISGAAPLAPEVQDGFESATGGRVVEGYGLTEAAPVTHCNPVMGDRRNGTIGLPFPGTDARIVEPGSGEPLPVGEVGELEVRGPQVMAGYWERPEETAAALRNGWLCTGDMARMSPDGYFTIVDRKKDLVIVGGMNVYPREVEEVLLAHPAVAEAAVIGVPEERHGEVPRAFVALKPGASVTPEELVQHCEANLARFKVPRTIELRPSLPKTMIGKVLRRDLRAEVEREAAKDGEP